MVETLDTIAEAFTVNFPIGTKVKYHPIIGRADHIVTEIRSEAWAIPSGAVIIKVKGIAGGVSIKAIERLDENQLAT